MTIVPYIVTAVSAYLVGSIPSGWLMGKAKGLDIRSFGSGNIGATNVFRKMGVAAGITVLLADALKGWVAVRVITPWIVHEMLPPNTFAESFHAAALVAALAAVLGHNYTFWLRFKGGKGIATSAGVLLALVPYALLIILAVWIIAMALTRYVSLASMLASFTLPFASWITGESPTIIGITAAMAALAIYKHRSNIKRLLEGTESRFGKKNAPPPAAPAA